MSNACLLEVLEVIQYDFAEAPIANPGSFVFQINGFRFLELIVKELASCENGVDHCCVIRI